MCGARARHATPRRRGSAGAVLLAGALLACPQLTDDDFRVGDGGAGPTGEAPAGGAAGRGGGAGGAAGGSSGGVDGAGAGSSGAAGAGRGGAAGAGQGGAAAGAGQGGVAGAGSSGAAGTESGGAGQGAGGSVGTGACSEDGFGAPTLVSELDLPGKLWGPALSDDGLTLYFAVESDVDAGDLYRATRATRRAPFTGATPIDELNTEEAEGTPYAGADGTLYFYSDRQGQPDIWRALRTTDGSFMAPEPVPAINSTEPDFLPCLSADGLRLVFGSNRGGAVGRSDLWIATRTTSQGTFSAALPLSELNTGARDEGASLTGDDLQVYFTSDREGSAGLDIWFSSRYNIWSGFSPPINLASANADGDDADVHISRDGRELLFSSARGGTRRIWRAERCP